MVLTAAQQLVLDHEAYLQHIVAVAVDAADADVEPQRRVEGGVRIGADHRGSQTADAFAALRPRVAAWPGADVS